MITKKVRPLGICLGLLYFLPCGIFLFSIVHDVKPSTQPESVNTVSSSRSYKPAVEKEFIYLVQAESCLPRHLLSPNQLGIGKTRDVLVLSWKERCSHDKSSSSLPHIKYVFKNGTTWGSGRNFLYHLARRRTTKYLYYIFLDEDLEFKFTEGIAHKDLQYNSSTNNSPLTAFENFLRGHEPAVGLMNFCSICGKYRSEAQKYVPGLCCSPRPSSQDFPPIFPVSISFDAGLNAFHRRAIRYLLPYNLEYESTSWWESQKFVILATDLFFRGQALRYTPVTAINTKHRDYPKAEVHNWRAILQKLRDRLPEKFRSLNIFEQEPAPNMDFNVRGDVLFTPRWNITIPPAKSPIVPLGHFQIL